MTKSPKVSELELMAYADGLYDARQTRRRRVEAHLRDHPDDAERVAVWQAQNRALRGGLAGLAEEPLPAGAAALLDDRRSARAKWQERRQMAGRIAASLLFVLVGIGAGWLWSEAGEQARPEIARFATLAAAQAGQGQSNSAEPLVAATAPGLEGARRGVAIALEAPDLTSHGFTLVSSGSLDTGGERMLRMSYQRNDGQRLDVLFRSRWDPDATDWTFASAGQHQAGAWPAVALDVAVATDLPTVEARAVLAAVERAMAASAALRPAGPGPHQATQPQSAGIGNGASITDTTAPLTAEPASVN